MIPAYVPTKMGRKGAVPSKEIILENSIPEPMSGCWIWTGRYFQARPEKGRREIFPYGRIFLLRKSWLAHRLSFEIFVGNADGKVIMHSCDNPACVNPAHLRAGTHAENMAEMVSRGRSYRGPKPWKTSKMRAA